MNARLLFLLTLALGGLGGCPRGRAEAPAPTPPPDEIAALYADLAARVASGALRVEVEATYAIEDIGAALAHAAREGRDGKILVTPNGPV